MSQARTKEEFVGSLDLIPSIVTPREQEKQGNPDIREDQRRTLSVSSSLTLNGAGLEEKTEALLNNHVLVQNKSPNSVILVSSKQAQRGIMSIVGQTVLKIDSGKRMILVPNVSRGQTSSSTLHPMPSQAVLLAEPAKQIIQVTSAASPHIRVVPDTEKDVYSVGRDIVRVTPIISNDAERKVANDDNEAASSTVVVPQSVNISMHPNNGNKNSETYPNTEETLKELLKKDIGTPNDNLNMLAHVSNQIFGSDQNIVYKNPSSSHTSQQTSSETRLDNKNSVLTTDSNTAVLYTCVDADINQGDKVLNVNYVPVLETEEGITILPNESCNGESPMDDDTNATLSGSIDGLRRRKRKFFGTSGHWRGRRVGHPFNPNSPPPPPDSPACATCVLFEHTLLKMATRGFWGGNKGCLEDVFRSIRVEGTDITDTVEDVTQRCYEFVRKKLVDLKDKRNDAYMYMRSYIDEFDGFLERVPPVAVVAMVIYLPMAADYEFVTWHGVPPTGWSEYRRAVIMREVFEVLYHFGTQTNSLPEYDRRFFQPRSESKILKERIFDMRQDGSIKGWVVKRGSYHVVYSEDVKIEDVSDARENVCDTTEKSPKTTGDSVTNSSDRGNSPVTKAATETRPDNAESLAVNEGEDSSADLEGTSRAEETSQSRKRKSETTEISPRRTSRRRRTRSSLRHTSYEEASDLSSVGGEDDITVAKDSQSSSLTAEGETDEKSKRVEAATTEGPTVKPSVITPQFVESIVSACGNSSSWNSPSNSTETRDSSPVIDDQTGSQTSDNDLEPILQNIQQSVVFESLWTKRAPDEPVVVMPDGSEKRFGAYLALHGVETSCPHEKTIIIVNAVKYKAREVLGYFRRGVQFVEHTREHGTTIDTLTTMKESSKSGAVRKIPPGKISKLVHPSLHLENYTFFILPIGASEGGSFSFKRKGFRGRMKRPRQRITEDASETVVKDEELSPKRIYSSEVSSSTASDGRLSSETQGSVGQDCEEYTGKQERLSPQSQYVPLPLNRDIKVEVLTNNSSPMPYSSMPTVETPRVAANALPVQSDCLNSKECQTQSSIISEGIQTEAISGILGHDLNVRLANSITDGIFKGFKTLIEQDQSQSGGNLSHLYSFQSLIDSYKKAGRFLLEMAENLETIMASDTVRKM